MAASAAANKVSNVLVVGATGGLGVHVVNGFLAERWRNVYNVYVLARAEKASGDKKQLLAAWAENGVNIRIGSITDAKTAADATKGIDIVVSVTGGFNTIDTQTKLIEGAKTSGVRRILLSDFGFSSHWYREAKNGGLSQLPAPLNYFKAGLANLNELAEKAGIEWTVVQNGIFFNYTLGPLGLGLGMDGKGSGPLQLLGGANTRFTITSRVDIGALIPYVLADPSSRNQFVDLAGDVVTAQQLVDLYNRHVRVAYGAAPLTTKVTSREEANKASQAALSKQPADTWGAFIAGLQLVLIDQHSVVEKAQSWNARHAPSYRLQTIEEYFRALGSSIAGNVA